MPQASREDFSRLRLRHPQDVFQFYEVIRFGRLIGRKAGGFVALDPIRYSCLDLA